ncbi:MAG: hypothetical protein FJ109_04700 [Deltaproteobacteria bacterium]|nr:hypothetical protein [Deltaproteobacteria bacterium]
MVHRVILAAVLLAAGAAWGCSNGSSKTDVGLSDVPAPSDVEGSDLSDLSDLSDVSDVSDVSDLSDLSDVSDVSDVSDPPDPSDSSDGSGFITGHWEQVNTAQLGEHVLNSVWGFADGNVIAVGEAGLVAAKVKDAFSVAYQEPSLNILNGVWGAASDDIWTVGMYGLIYHWDGLQWGMPSFCKGVGDCSFSGTCLLAQCVDNKCQYTPTGKAECCGSTHFGSTFDAGPDLTKFQVQDLYAGTSDGGVLWQVAGIVSADGKPRYMSAPSSLYFGIPGKQCVFDPAKNCPDYANGKPVGAVAASPPVSLPLAADQATLSFYLYLDVESSPLTDLFKVQVYNAGKWEDAWSKASLSPAAWKSFVPVKVDLSKYIGKTVQVRFYFDSVNANNNGFEGVYVDNVQISSTCSVAGALAGKFPTLWSIWGVDEDSIYAVGNEGVVLHWDGVSWQPHGGDTKGNIYGVGGSSAKDVVLVGGEGLVMRSNGGPWKKEISNTGKHLARVWCTSAVRCLAVGPGGGATYWKGGSWQANGTFGTGDLTDVHGLKDDDFYVTGRTGKLFHFDGSLAQPVAVPVTVDLWSVWVHDDGTLTVAGNDTVLSGPADLLVPEAMPVITGWKGVWATGKERFVVGEYGKVLRDDGSGWKKMDAMVETSLLDVYGFGPKDVWAVGEGKTAVHYDGTKWTRVKVPGPAESVLSNIWGPAPDDLYVTAQLEDFGYLLHWDGKGFQIALAEAKVTLRDVHGTGDDNIMAVGQLATIARWDGKGWGLLPVDPYPLEDGSEYYVTQNLHGVFIRTPEDGWAVGEQGVIVHYDGVSFSLAGLFDVTLRDVFALSAENVWAVGNSGTVLRFDQGNWNQEPTGTVATLRGIWSDPLGNVWAVGDNGTVLRFVPDK